jgi:hypothetical protein
MKLIVYTYFVLILFSCSSSNLFAQDKKALGYLIKKIRTKNSWYIIYVERQDSLYKIVTGREKSNKEDCQKIVIGKYYNLSLYSRRENAPVINGVKLKPANQLDVECYEYDDKTQICIEPRKGIYDLYYTKDLRGLCYLK